MAWEVLGHRDNAGVAMRQDKGASKLGDRVGVGTEASLPLSDHRVGWIKIEIDHRAKIEVEAGLGQILGHARVETLCTVLITVTRVSADAPSRRNVDMAIAPREPLHQAALLVDGDEGNRYRSRIV